MPQNEDMEPDIPFDTYQSITINKKVPCGNIYCIFDESENTFHRLTIKGEMAKNSPCGESWLNAIAKLITFSMRRGIWEGNVKRGIIKQLLGQRCPSYIPNREHILSCSDAIARCVLEYSKSRDIVEE